MISGCGETGRRARFRFLWETMQVQVLSSAPFMRFIEFIFDKSLFSYSFCMKNV